VDGYRGAVGGQMKWSADRRATPQTTENRMKVIELTFCCYVFQSI